MGSSPGSGCGAAAMAAVLNDREGFEAHDALSAV
jgi:hypothetical protein